MFRAFVMGPHYLTRAVVPEMKKRQFGRIIHVTSEVFQCGSAPFSAYEAGKVGRSVTCAAQRWNWHLST